MIVLHFIFIPCILVGLASCQSDPLGGIILTGWMIFMYYKVYKGMKEEDELDAAAREVRERNAERSRSSLDYWDNPTSNRSEWEKDIASYIRDAYPSCRIVTNDRTVITASDGYTPLEIDIYIPELKLGIEADGIHWHDRDAYDRDRRNGTEYSEEMYKERYCARKGIKLIHV